MENYLELLLDYLPWILILAVGIMGWIRTGFHGGMGVALLCLFITYISAAFDLVWIGIAFSLFTLMGYLRIPKWLWWGIIIAAIGAGILWWQNII